MKRKIVAIGGGKIMVPPGRPPQTLSIDHQIVKLSGKKKPKVLFIPTASIDDADYCRAIERLYGDILGCRVDHLLLYRERPQKKVIKQKILHSHIIYVGGGNTLRMMMLWRRLGVDKLLNKARLNGSVLCGLSAGCICWFRQGNSDSRKFTNENDKTLIKVSGLSFIDLLACPHYDVERHRQASLKNMMQKVTGCALALENRTAIEIVDNRYRILTSGKYKHAWKVYWRAGKYIKEKLPNDSYYRPLSELC